MSGLVMLFLPNLVGSYLRAFVFCLASALVFRHLLGPMNPLWADAIAFGANFATGFALWLRLFPANAQWLVTLPVSRTRLLVFNGALNAVNFALCLVGASLALRFNAWVLGESAWRTLPGLLAFRATVADTFAHVSPFLFIQMVASFFLVGSVLVFAVASPASTGAGANAEERLKLSHWLHRAKRQDRWAFGLGAVIATGLSVLLFPGTFLGSPYGAFGVCFLPSLALLVVLAASHLGASREERKRWALSTLIPGGLLLVAFPIAGARALSKGTPSEQLEAVRVLHPFLTPDRAVLANLIAQPPNDSPRFQGTARWLQALYLSRYTTDGRIRSRDDQYLPLEKALFGKTTAAQLATVLDMYDVASLGRDEVKAFLTAWDHFGALGDAIPLLELLAVPLTTDAVAKMIESPVASEAHYGLLKARYQRDASLVPVVKARLGAWQGSELGAVALRTFAILVGQPMTADAWKKMKGLRSPASLEALFAKIDCRGFSRTDARSLRESDAVRLNLCLREAADKRDLVALSRLERLGWLEPPLDSEVAALVETLLYKTRRNATSSDFSD